jgi:hypothetical protein
VLHAALAKLHLPPEKIEELIPVMTRALDNPEGCPIDDHLPPSEYLRGALHGMLHYLAAEHLERCAVLQAPEAALLPSPRSPRSEEDFLGSPASLVSPPSPPGALLLSRNASEDAVGQPAAAAAALTTPPKRRPSKVRRFLQKMLTPGSSAAAAAAAAAAANGGAPAATAGAAAAAVNSAKSSPGRDAPTAGAYACSAGSDAGENGELGLSELGDNSGAWREALTPALEDEESSALAAVAVAAADATGSNRKSLRAAGRSSFAKLWGRDDVAGDVVTGASGHNSLVSTDCAL